MKLVLAIVMLLIVGSGNSQSKKTLPIKGAYKMLSQSVKSDSTDTTFANANQLKIYTDDYMMYANVNSPDSTSGFGVGSYSIDNDTVTENIIYNAYDSTANSTPATYKLYIKKSDKGYQQIIKGMQNNTGQKFDLTEIYESVGTGATTPLDGAWKQTARYEINGKDTTKSDVMQYKTYLSGYCIWGNNWKDSSNKVHTGIGYGRFTMSGSNKVKESMIASTFYEVRGKDFDIDIEMTGRDKFKQTINAPDGGKSVEFYERLKK
jgi:hypothetical protein